MIIDARISIVPEGRKLFLKITVLEDLRSGAFSEEGEKEIHARLENVFLLFPRLKERLDCADNPGPMKQENHFPSPRFHVFPQSILK
jgi:ABC-type branched-subunit amino acid transport system ATPase component